MGFFERVDGTVKSFFQIGNAAGPGFYATSGAMEVKNAANNAYAVMRGAAPVGDDDFVTKAYNDKTSKPLVCTAQISGAADVPTNTNTAHFIVVTTTGGNASIGDVYWDDGLNTGDCSLITAASGNQIVTTAAFTGGTISLDAQQMYIWSGSAWTNVSPNVSGAVKVIRFSVTTTTASSTTSIPANAVILDSQVDITTPYDTGTIAVGRTGSTALLQATTDSLATVAGSYDALQKTAWGATELPVLATIAGGPASGGATVTVSYCVPNA